MLLRRAKKAIVVIEGMPPKDLKKFNFVTLFGTENVTFKNVLDFFLEEIEEVKPIFKSLNDKSGHFILEINKKLIKGNITISEKEHYTKA